MQVQSHSHRAISAGTVVVHSFHLLTLHYWYLPDHYINVASDLGPILHLLLARLFPIIATLVP